MYASGYFEQQRRSPVSLAAVIGLHGAAFVALALYGTTQYVANKAPRTDVFNVPMPEPPPPVPPPPPQPRTERQTQQPPDQVTAVRTENPVSTIAGPETPQRPWQPTAPTGPIRTADATPVIPPPVRRAAEVDPNYRDALQPPYPSNEERAQREGQVRVRITIGGSIARMKAGPLIMITAAIKAAWSRMTSPRLVGLLRFCAKKPVSGMTTLLVLAPTQCRREGDDILYRHLMLYH